MNDKSNTREFLETALVLTVFFAVLLSSLGYPVVDMLRALFGA